MFNLDLGFSSNFLQQKKKKGVSFSLCLCLFQVLKIMSGTSASARSDKSGKNSKGLPLAAVKDEFASSSKRKNTCTKIEYEILKENHETLKIDYESLQKRFKLAEETYEVMKKLLLQSKKAEGVGDKYEKMESEGKGKIDELRKREEELLLAIRKGKEDKAKLEDKFVALAERFCVVEADCEYLKSLYDAEVAASEIEETNKLRNNVKNDATGICVYVCVLT